MQSHLVLCSSVDYSGPVPVLSTQVASDDSLSHSISLPPPHPRFVPTDWASKAELTLEEVNKLNKLNLELASGLAARNPAYTPFQHGNFTCIMIKEVSGDHAVTCVHT